MLRFWDPQDGSITLEDSDLRTYRLDELRGQVALVAQDTYLFNASIRDNLRVARPEATEDELMLAVGRAGLADFIESLPDGLDTPVGERGAQLSGGQRQRVAIGRALLKDAPVLILDEATSHLDGLNERLVRGRPRRADGAPHDAGDRPPPVDGPRRPTRSWCSTRAGSSRSDATRSSRRRMGLYARLVRRQLAGARR